MYAMDETSVWSDMVFDTIVGMVETKTVHEKCRVSARVTAKADGTKDKPFVVFKGVKRDVDVLNNEFIGKCYVASSQNGYRVNQFMD